MGLFSSRRAMQWVLFLAGSSLFVNAAAIADVPASVVEVQHQATSPSEGQPSHFNGIFNHLETEFALSAGLRSDNFDWSISGDSSGHNPNILSELEWSGVDSYQLSLSNRTRYKRHIYLRGHFNYAFIRNGRVRDSDYGQNDRTAEWSRSISETNDDQLWDLSAGAGYTFFFLEEQLAVSPLIGFSYNKLNFRIENGIQEISEDNPFSASSNDNPPPVGPLSGRLNSTYFASWTGPWVGCDLQYKMKDRAPAAPPGELGLSLELHWADYYGESNWNLRSDLEHPKSFEHDATGYGIRLAADAVIRLAGQWALRIAVDHQNWITQEGTCRVFSVAEGTSRTQLNEVHWSSTSIMIGAVYTF